MSALRCPSCGAPGVPGRPCGYCSTYSDDPSAEVPGVKWRPPAPLVPIDEAIANLRKWGAEREDCIAQILERVKDGTISPNDARKAVASIGSSAVEALDAVDFRPDFRPGRGEA